MAKKTVAPWRNRIVETGTLAPAQIIPNPENWREHPEKQQKAMSGALAQLGWVQPVIINRTTGRLIDGHMRVALALRQGEESVPVSWVELSEAEERVALATIDPLGDLANKNEADLYSLIDQLSIDEADLAAFVGELDERDDDAKEEADPTEKFSRADELQDKWQVVDGDVWIAGRQRIVCGDSTNPDRIAAAAAGRLAASVVTDPPYGISMPGVHNDGEETLFGLFRDVIVLLPIKDAVVAAFQSPRLVWKWISAVQAAGHSIERLLWFYRASSRAYAWRGWVMKSDAIVLSSIGSPTWPEPDGHRPDTYVQDTADKSGIAGSHPTIKPGWVLRDIIGKLPDGLVFDPFLGSGSTLVACEELGRDGAGIELDPKYVAVALERLQLLGLEPKRELPEGA
jgi:DNA modification methylase